MGTNPDTKEAAALRAAADTTADQTVLSKFLSGIASLFGASSSTPSEQLANWLPYLSYRSSERLFVNREGLGFMLEMVPQCGANDVMAKVLSSLYANSPPGTGIQIQLLGSPHIHDRLREFANLRAEDEDALEKSKEWGRPARNTNVFRSLARRRFSHFEKHAHESLTSGYHYTFRDFRLILSVTCPGNPDNRTFVERVLAMRDSMGTTLRAAQFENWACDANDLINWASMFTNPDRLRGIKRPDRVYDAGREVRDQVVDFDTVHDTRANAITLRKLDGSDPLELRFFSVKAYPERFALWQMGSLAGDMTQFQVQYRCPFAITLGVHILDPNSTKAIIQANHARAVQNTKSELAAIMPDTEKKRQDWEAVSKVVDEGGTLVSLYHSITLFCDPATANQSAEAARALWRSRGFDINPDIFMGEQALLSNLPMTLGPNAHKDLLQMKRVTRKTTVNAVHLAPLISEWKGTPTPALLFAGRRGQVTSYDFYDMPNNPHFAIIGSPGGGKSVLLNEIAQTYASMGARVWIQEIGRSMERLCKVQGGQHIEFRHDRPLCFNPFPLVRDIKEDMAMIFPMMCKMASQRPLEEVQEKAIVAMVLKQWQKYGADLEVTAIRDAFVSGTLEEFDLVNDQRLKDLSLMLSPYARGGQYEKFFSGKDSVDLDNDFVVFEAEELRRTPDLQLVVNIVLFYSITYAMYEPNRRHRKKVWIIDELAQQLGTSKASDELVAKSIEEAARRARKYGGCLGTATQQGGDYFLNSQMEAALKCAATTMIFPLKREELDLLRAGKQLQMDDTKYALLSSLRKAPGKYSELYVSGELGEGVFRLPLDPYSGLMYSNTLADNQPIDQLRAKGMPIAEALEAVLRSRGQA